MKVSFLLALFVLSGVAFAEEHKNDPYAKLDHLLKDGEITEEYLEALLKEMDTNKDSIKTLKAGGYKEDDYDSIRYPDYTTYNAPTNYKNIRDNGYYDYQQDKYRKMFDYVSQRFNTDYDKYEKVARNIKVPLDFCPTSRATPCSDFDYSYRQVNGWCNNFKWPEGGAAGTVYGRLLPPNYDKYCDAPTVKGKSGYNLPNARDVALELFRHVETDSTVTNFFLFFGQFFDHDLVLTPIMTTVNKTRPSCKCDVPDPKCTNIPVPKYDPYFKNTTCLRMVRDAAAVSNTEQCKFSCREQLTDTTHALDLSSLYGWFKKSNDEVRAHKWGMLKWSEYYNTIIPAFQNYSNYKDGCKYNPPHTQCMVSGDERTEDNAFLFLVQTLFFYEHNRIAKELSKYNPYCSDETLFQETRRILIALFQKIVYNDWLPIALGEKIMRKFDLIPEARGHFFYGYDDSKFPTLYNEFGLAMRFGHTMIKDDFFAADEYCNPIKKFGTNDVLFVHNWIIGSIDGIGRGMVCDNTYYKHDQMTTDLTDHLFENMFGPGGSSLSAVNTQRCRDHGLRPYQDVRRYYKLSTSTDFYKLFGIRYETQKKLAKLYYSPDDIDFWVGIAIERSFKNYDPEGGILGETLSYFIADQFRQLKYSDRFFWESGDKRSNPFTSSQLDHIRSVNFGSLICQHIHIKQIPKNPFRVPGPDNPIISCDKFRNIDVDFFKIRSCGKDYNKSYNDKY